MAPGRDHHEMWEISICSKKKTFIKLMMKVLKEGALEYKNGPCPAAFWRPAEDTTMWEILICYKIKTRSTE